MKNYVEQAHAAARTGLESVRHADPSAHIAKQIQQYPSVQALIGAVMAKVSTLSELSNDLSQIINMGMVDQAQGAMAQNKAPDTLQGSAVNVGAVKSLTAKISKIGDASDLIGPIEALAKDEKLIAHINALYKASHTLVDIQSVRGALKHVSFDHIGAVQQLKNVSAAIKKGSSAASNSEEAQQVLAQAQAEVDQIVTKLRPNLEKIMGHIDTLLAKSFV